MLMMYIVDSRETTENKPKSYGEWTNGEDKMEH